MVRQLRVTFAGALLLGLGACGASGPPRPGPTLHAVEPAQVDNGSPRPLLLTGEGFFADLSDHLDQRGEAHLDARFTVTVGGTEVSPVTFVNPEQLEVVLPADFPAGVHDVEVTTAAGATARKAAAVKVTQALLFALSIEDQPGGLGTPVADRVLTAGGPPLRAYAVARSPSFAFAFDVAAEWSLSEPLGALVISPDGRSVELSARQVGSGKLRAVPADARVAPGQTGVLTVTAGGAAALGFRSAPRTVVAGSCSPAVEVETRDLFGNLARVSQDTPLMVTGSVGVQLFSDSSCAVGLNPVTLPAAQSSTVFYFRATVAGPLLLDLSASGLAPAQQTQTVVPATVSAFELTGFPSPVQAGVTGTFSVRATDAFGNTVPDYAGTVTFSSSDSAATLPAGYSFQPADLGRHVFGAVLRTAGTSALTAVDGAVTGSQTGIQVRPGPAGTLAFSFIGTQAVGNPFDVTLRALDSFGNLATAFVATATLTSSPTGVFSCAAGCPGAMVTAAFLGGQWSGTLRPGSGSAGSGRLFFAAAGALTATSNPFDVQPAPVSSPPVARFFATPGIAKLPSATVAFDGTAVSDTLTPYASLQLSWDFTGTAPGAPGGAGWTPWSTAKTASRTYSTAGSYRPRLAVRDTAGFIGYTEGYVVVLAASSALCTVNTAADVDDGATDCATTFGADGKLSLTEALAIASADAVPTVLTFSAALNITQASGSQVLPFGPDLTVVGYPGTVLSGFDLSFVGANNTVSSLSVVGGRWTLSNSATLRVSDLEISDFGGIGVAGDLTAERVAFRRCLSSCVETVSANSTLRIAHCEFLDSPLKTGVLLTLANPDSAVIHSNVFARLRTGVEVQNSKGAEVVNNTFDANATGVVYSSSVSGQVLVNNVFSNQTVTAVGNCLASFAARSNHVFHQNAAIGCVAADSNALNADPGYLLPGSDYRLRQTSTGLIDTGAVVTYDLNGTAPALFFGSGRDRGGRETW